MPRSRLIGFTALAFAVLGYGGFAALVVMAKMDMISTTMMLAVGVPVAVIGEAGLWIAAGCLGWTLFKGRKALFDRVFRRNRTDAV